MAVARSPINPFRQEYAAIHFARAILQHLREGLDNVFPSLISVSAANWRSLWYDKFPFTSDLIKLQFHRADESDVRFALPPWVNDQNRWKYQLGQILRVLLTGQIDYTATVAMPDRERSHILYTAYASSWLRRRYGLFNGRSAFGPSWQPISSWLGSLLSRLLEWPGFARFDFDFELDEDFDPDDLDKLLLNRLRYLESLYGRASYTPVLPIRVPKMFMRPVLDAVSLQPTYMMRVGVVQTVIPNSDSFSGDPQLKNPVFRRKHRRHISAVLGAVHRMLQVRETHRSDGAGVELLLFPELSIHQYDVRTHLFPFVLQHRCIVFAGLVFHPLPNKSLINSACWLIPVSTPHGGLRVETIEQGKCNLTPAEIALGATGFRPSQWILEIADPTSLRKLWAHERCRLL